MAQRDYIKGRDATHRYLYFDLAHSGDNTEDFHYIDLARVLSMVNRRLYRQGMVYHVANVSVHDSAADAEVRFCTAPNTWWMRKAWNEAFKAWKKQRSQALDSIQSGGRKTGAYSDFKVYLNHDHVSDPDWPKPEDTEDDTAVGGEWNYSDIAFVKDAVEYNTHGLLMMGDHEIGSATTTTSGGDGTLSGCVSILEMFNEITHIKQEMPAGDTEFSSSVLGGMNLLAMGADANFDDILEDIDDENDFPPYTQSFYLGTNNSMEAPWVVREVEIDGGGSSGQKMGYVGGFPVPCGLLCIETKGNGDYSSSDNIIGICIELVPGDYKGVAAEPMWG